MIGRADIEGSKSHVAMNAWRPQASSLVPKRWVPAKRARRFPLRPTPVHCTDAASRGRLQGTLSGGGRLFLGCSREDPTGTTPPTRTPPQREGHTEGGKPFRPHKANTRTFPVVETLNHLYHTT